MSDDRERRRPVRSWSQGHNRGDRPPAPNVKPKLSQKKEKPSKARRSRSISSERAERGRRRDRHQGERSRRGRSEEARRRDRKDGDGKRRAPEDDVDDTECAVCFCSYDNIFKTPKLLACGHTFCLECLARINVTSPEIKTLCCPVCRELTDLPHGQDLPRLGNNQDIIGKLPPEMHKMQSIRFKRSKGKLLLKNPPLSGPTSSNAVTLPKKNQDGQATAAGGGLHLAAAEQGTVPATVLDVGRPPNRVRGRLRRLFRSDQCYYTVVASIITITVALMLVGILAFVIIPNVVIRRPPTNQTSPTPSGG